MYNEMIEKENREFKRNILDNKENIRDKYNDVDQEKRDYWKDFKINEMLEAKIINEKEADIFREYNWLITFKNEKTKSSNAENMMYSLLMSCSYNNIYK